ncbi:hypothetical protein KGO06_01610 [Patescibacteria group bacterium]|nr:hypothetical protein [Patescibacteria group bacterium]
MSLNVAAIAEVALETVPPVPFINWQYVYCWLISLIGGGCTDAGIPLVSGSALVSGGGAVSPEGVSAAQSALGSGFWSWLWPFQAGSASAEGVVTAGGAVSILSQFFSAIAGFIPQPVVSAFFGVAWFLGALWGAFSFISYAISGVFVLAIIGAAVLLCIIRITEWRKYRTVVPHTRSRTAVASRWQELLSLSMSKDPKQWKEAIRSADTFLGDVLSGLGYTGTTVSEQLRAVPEGAFVTLPQAWEAHRIHNFVVERGSQFILTQREAFRTMKLYEQVLEEFRRV